MRSEDPADADADLAAIFARVHLALEPGGLFAFDLAGPDRGAPREAQRDWTEGEGWAVLVETTQTGSLLRRRIISFRDGGEANGGAPRRRTCSASTPPSGVLEHLRAAGFRARAVVGWAGERERPGHCAFIARRT